MTNRGANEDLARLLSAEQRGELMVLASAITERMRRSIGVIFEAVGEDEEDGRGSSASSSAQGVGGKVPEEEEEVKVLLLEPIGHTDLDEPPPTWGKKFVRIENSPGNPLEDIQDLSIVDSELQILAPEPMNHQDFPEAQTSGVKGKEVEVEKPSRATPGVPEPSPPARPRTKRTSAPKLRRLRRKALASHDEWAVNVLHRIGEALSRSAPGGKEPRNELGGGGGGGGGAWGTVLEPEWPEVYRPVPTLLTLWLSPDSAKLVTQAVLLLLLSLEKYDARSRMFLLVLAASLGVSAAAVNAQECETARTLIAVSRQMSADAESRKRADEGRLSKRWKVGLASIAGAAVIGVTGGLAAPFVAAGIGGLLSGVGLGATAVAGLLGSVAGSGAIMGSLFGAYGGMMTGGMVERYSAEVEDFAFIPVRGGGDSRLRVTIGISGWLTSPDDVVLPWKALNANSEVYALRWEMDALLDLGSSLEQVLKSYAWSYVKFEIIKRTVLASLWAAIWPVALLRAARVIDNPFSIAKHRSEKAGRVLADAIVNKAQGERPVTLIGFSLGARTIYYCLLSLAERGAYGLVENVVLMGAPVPSNNDGDVWSAVRTVVAGRVVNVYSGKDYILGFLYRTSSVQLGVAGLQPVHVAGVENLDVSDRVEGHLRYRHVAGVILKEIFGGEDVDVREIGREKEILRGLELKDEQDEIRRKEREASGGGVDLSVDGEIDGAVSRAEKELEERRVKRAKRGRRGQSGNI